LYYVDTETEGPYQLTINSTLPIPQGGGGTSFGPFFDRVAETWDEKTQSACIYLTDGYGEFPFPLPVFPTLWVVTPGGLGLSEFPFGEAVRLIDRN
jgi:predicted metal-dependent peptidase